MIDSHSTFPARRVLSCALILVLASCGGDGDDSEGGSFAAAPSYSIGGTVSGLTGTGLVLQNNQSDALPISTNGAFAFAGGVATGGAYAVTVGTQPSLPTQVCVVANGSGTVVSANVTNVTVTCTGVPLIPGGSAPEAATAQASGGDLAVDDAGNAIAVWSLYDGTSYSVWANRYRPGSGWAGPELLETSDDDATLAVAAVEPGGIMQVAWVQSGGVWVNRYVEGAGWSGASSPAVEGRQLE